MSLPYICFLFKNIIKNKKNWIVWAIYFLFLVVILVLMPLFIKTSSNYVWTNSLLMIQAMLLIPIAICASILSISIFKESQDDGTEILILSKPISRIKNVLSKVFVYVSTSLVVNFVVSLSCFLILLVPYNTIDAAVNLFGTNFFISFILFIFYGAIATLISLRLNKTWTVLLSVILTVVCNILNGISPIIFKSPTSEISSSKDGNHSVQTYHLISSQGDDNRLASISNSITSADDLSKTNFLTNFNQASILWNTAQKGSSLQKFGYANFTLQTYLMYNGLWMKDGSNFISNQVFASSNYYKYEIKNQFYEKIQNNYLNTNLIKTLPSIFYNDVSAVNVNNDFMSMMQNIISLTYKNNLRTIGHKYSSINFKNTENYLKIAKIENIANNPLDKIRYESADLEISKEQADIFKEVIQEIFNNKHWNLERDNFSNFYKVTLNNLDFDENFQNIYDYLHYVLTSEENKKIFNIHSVLDLNQTVLKFKYYLFNLFASPSWNEVYHSVFKTNNDNLGFLTYQNLLKYRFKGNILNQNFDFALPLIIPVDEKGNLLNENDINNLTNPLINKEWLLSCYKYFFNNADDPSSNTDPEKLKSELINWKMLDLLEQFIYPENKFGFISINQGNSERVLYQNFDNFYFVDLNYCWDFGEFAFEYDSSEIINSLSLVIIWLAISIIITLIATIVYFKTDFK